MRHTRVFMMGLTLFAALQIPALAQEKPPPKKPAFTPRPAPVLSYKYLEGQRLVFVANGAGGSIWASKNLCHVNQQLNLGLRVHDIPWCRHYTIIHDLTDDEAQMRAAAAIACNVTAIRKECKTVSIFFVGNSAGARVVLSAADMLPEKSIQRIILLSPAVSSGYDLRPALKTATAGIDNFYSTDDSILETAEEHQMFADGGTGFAAGLRGFRPVSADAKDVALYRNLRQHRWTEANAGNGGHFAWTMKHNMREVLPPLFNTTPSVETGPPTTPDLKKLPVK